MSSNSDYELSDDTPYLSQRVSDTSIKIYSSLQGQGKGSDRCYES